jgi:hypothetical protein
MYVSSIPPPRLRLAGIASIYGAIVNAIYIHTYNIKQRKGSDHVAADFFSRYA